MIQGMKSAKTNKRETKKNGFTYKETRNMLWIGGMRSFINIVVFPFLLSIFAGLCLTLFIYKFPVVVSYAKKILPIGKQDSKPTSAKKIPYSFSKDRLKEYAMFESLFTVDPYALKKRMDAKDVNFLLVDVRSPSEYKQGHIRGGINIPAYANLDAISTIDERKEQIVSAFKKHSINNKELILYAGSSFSEAHRKVAFFLLERSIDCRILAVGWNEWRHLTNFWLPESEWGTVDMQSYITIP